jgi:hypothetical protein
MGQIKDVSSDQSPVSSPFDDPIRNGDIMKMPIYILLPKKVTISQLGAAEKSKSSPKKKTQVPHEQVQQSASLPPVRY